MKKVKSLKELATFMEKLGATKEIEPGFTAWTLDCGPMKVMHQDLRPLDNKKNAKKRSQ